MSAHSSASLEAMLALSNPLWSTLSDEPAGDARAALEAVLHAAAADPLEYAHFVCEDPESGSFTVLAFTALHLIVVTRVARGSGTAGMSAVVRSRAGLRALIFSRGSEGREDGATTEWPPGTITIDYGNAELYNLGEPGDGLSGFLPSLKRDLSRG